MFKKTPAEKSEKMFKKCKKRNISSKSVIFVQRNSTLIFERKREKYWSKGAGSTQLAEFQYQIFEKNMQKT